MNNISITEKELKELKNLNNRFTEIIEDIQVRNRPMLEDNRSTKKVLKGLYLEPDIDEAIDTLTKDKKKGSRSQLVNQLLKQELKKHELL